MTNTPKPAPLSEAEVEKWKACDDLDEIALRAIATIEAQRETIQRLREALQRTVERCAGCNGTGYLTKDSMFPCQRCETGRALLRETEEKPRA